MKRQKLASRKSAISAKLIASYRRLKRLDALDLPDDDPRMKARGERAMLAYELSKASGVKPWTTTGPEADRAEAFYDALRKAAKVPKETLDKLEAIEARKEAEAIRSAEDHALNGPHPWPREENRERAMAEFEERHGYRPGAEK